MSNNIAEIRKKKGLSQTELAEAIGTTLNNFGKLERGDRRLNEDWISKIAKALEVSRGAIIDDSEPLDIGRTPDLTPTLRSEDGSIPLRHLDLSLSMGDGTNLDEFFEEGVFEFDAALLRQISRAPSERLIVGQGIGDSMFPTLQDRDMVIFDTTQTHLNATDKIWAISLFGAGGIKRLRPVSRTRVLIMSDNPNIPDQEVDADDLRILGRIIWSARRH